MIMSSKLILSAQRAFSTARLRSMNGLQSCHSSDSTPKPLNPFGMAVFDRLRFKIRRRSSLPCVMAPTSFINEVVAFEGSFSNSRRYNTASFMLRTAVPCRRSRSVASRRLRHSSSSTSTKCTRIRFRMFTYSLASAFERSRRRSFCAYHSLKTSGFAREIS